MSTRLAGSLLLVVGVFLLLAGLMLGGWRAVLPGVVLVALGGWLLARNVPDPEEPATRCAVCGRPVDEGARFCAGCGSPLS